MATISDVAGLVANDILKRGDLTTMLVNRCADAYLTMCQKVPFEELQTGPEKLTCTIDDPNVDLTTLTEPLAGICSIKIIYATGSALRLHRDHTRNYDTMPTIKSNRPNKYARWGKKIELWPPPDQAYDIYVRYWKQGKLSNPVSNTTLVIPDAWKELLMYETLYRAYIALNRPQDAQGLTIGSMQPRMPSSKKIIVQEIGIIPRLWNELLTTISQRENVDEDFSINPLRH